MTPLYSNFPLKPLRFMAPLRGEKVDEVPVDGEYLGLEQFESWTGRLSGVLLQQPPEGGANSFQVGDVLFGKLRPYLAKGWVAERQGYCTTESLVLCPVQSDSRFIRYCLLTDEVVSAVDGSTFGSKMPRADWGFIGSVKFPCPTKDEQARIANFLDDKMARIDALIAEKESFRVAVREYFSARLGTAVVQGIRPNRKLVGAEAKGFEGIPDDWTLTPIKHLASASGGMTPSKDNDDFWKGDIPWVSPKDMKRFVLHDSADHISQLALDTTSLKKQPVESVLVVVRGMILAHTFPVALNAVPVTINQDMKALHVKERVSARYLAWMLRGLQSLMLALTEESAHGTKALRTDQWANQCVPVPTNKEQIELVLAFERWERESEELTSHLDQHIARLREYRSSLISAAVTGQMTIQ
jgi:type I restriction enzyme S subunit